jgi:hypothetical protein
MDEVNLVVEKRVFVIVVRNDRELLMYNVKLIAIQYCCLM